MTLHRAVRHAYNNAIPIVAPAGNFDALASSRVPCKFSEVVCVGSINLDYAMEPISGYGAAVNILAPGTDVLVLDIADEDDYKEITGTSAACAIVAGDIAAKISWEALKLPQSRGMAWNLLLMNAHLSAVRPESLRAGTPNILLNTGIQHPDKWSEQPYRYANSESPPSRGGRTMTGASAASVQRRR